MKRKLSSDPDMVDDAEQSRQPSRTQTTMAVSVRADNERSPNTSSLATATVLQEGTSPDIYNSNIFKLQTEEMLSEIRLDYAERIQPINQALHKLKDLIESIADREPTQLIDACAAVKSTGIEIPFPSPRPKDVVAYSFGYAKPTNVNVFGDFALKTMLSMDTPYTIDMAVTMPSCLFQKKDYLNYRYFYKRAFYLSCIAAGLKDSGMRLKYDRLCGNHLQPILVVEPLSDKEESYNFVKFAIRIIPSFTDTFFPTAKLHPDQNTIRPNAAAEPNAKTLDSTPFYNASMICEMSHHSYLKLLFHSSKSAPGFKDACLLGRIWLQQRGFDTTIARGGFGSSEWQTLTALLLQSGGVKGHSVLSQEYDSYQIFKSVIQYIANTNLVDRPFVFKATGFTPMKSDSPMLFDGPRGLNLLFKMTPSSYHALKMEAKLTVESLNNEPMVDAFEATFIVKKNVPLLQFEDSFTVLVPTSSVTPVSLDSVSKVNRLSLKIYAVLKEGLGDRITAISVSPPEPAAWPICDKEPSVDFRITVGCNFDPAHVDRLVDHGPPAEDRKKSAEFQKLWGQKAELRRFKDGSILESVVWTVSEANPVFRQTVTFLLKRHFEAEVQFGGGPSQMLLQDTLTAHQNYAMLRDAYRKLEADLRQLETLPLQLRQLSMVDSKLRSASQQLPTFDRIQSPSNYAEVLVEFEGSGRWPDNLKALQRTKAAFLIKIGQSLEDCVEGLGSKVGLENTESLWRNCAFLDVRYPSGAEFRLRILVEREIILLERLSKDKSLESNEKENVFTALSEHKRTYQQLPLLSQSISTCCTKFPALSSTIRLVKKWFSSHKLCLHIPEELIELMVMKVYLEPSPWQAPSNATTGLLRTLHFISRWDWRTTPLLVDFGNNLTVVAKEAVNLRFEAWRKIDPAMNRIAVFAASSHDTTGTAFTDSTPSKVIAARMTALARAACKLVKDDDHDFQLKSLFETSTKDFDFVIKISNAFIKATQDTSHSRKSRYKNLQIQEESLSSLETSHKNPVEAFVNELRAIYESCVVFLYDGVANDWVAGLWKPQARARDFKINLPYSSKPNINKDPQQAADMVVDIAKSAILSEITRLGGNMIASIDCKT